MTALVIRHSSFIPPMLPLLADYDPTAILKDAGFITWLGYAIAAYLLYGKLMERRDARDAREEAAREGAKTKDVRLMPTPLQVKEAKTLATEDDLERLEADLKREIVTAEGRADQKTKLLFKKGDQMHEHIESTKDTLMKAGNERLEAITGQINALAITMNDKIEQSMKEAYHRINNHAERIAAAEARLGMKCKN